MNSTFKNIYQFKLSMKGIIPQIWRRIQVPENYTFLDLHRAIQASMSWEDYHLHEFEVRNS
ncbi:MAG TPA: plasmid pRiA4b ORF-3 family protein [Methanosarcina sp.]